MITALVNGRILTDTGFETGRAVLVDGARITAIVARDDALVPVAVQHDLLGRYLLPGFIDCQVNGGGGVLFNDDPSVTTIRRIGAAHRPFGTSGFLPTLMSDDLEVMLAAIKAVEQAIDAGVPGVLGIHLEGPFLSPERRGVHDAAWFRQPDDKLLEVVCSLPIGRTLLTVAPECIRPESIRELVDRGIVVSAGHTAASYEVARTALDAGMSGFTHLFNAMSPLQSRAPGVVGAALEDRSSWCGLIVDGHHLHPAALRIALAAKPKGQLFLVTDAMPPVGSATMTFKLHGEQVTCRDGRCQTDSGVLAGSCLDMSAAVRNTVRQAGVTMEEAVRMASTYPAAFLRLNTARGRIGAGLSADFVVMNDDFSVQETWIGGRPS